MAAEKVGIEHLKALLGFILDLISVVMKAIEAGKVGISDAFRLLGLVKEAVGAFKNLAAVKDEVADLSDDEKGQLVALVEAKLDIKNEALKGYIEQGLQGLLALLGVYGSFVK